MSNTLHLDSRRESIKIEKSSTSNVWETAALWFKVCCRSQVVLCGAQLDINNCVLIFFFGVVQRRGLVKRRAPDSEYLALFQAFEAYNACTRIDVEYTGVINVVIIDSSSWLRFSFKLISLWLQNRLLFKKGNTKMTFCKILVYLPLMQKFQSSISLVNRNISLTYF